MAISKDDQITNKNIVILLEKSCHKKMEALIFYFYKIMTNVNFFFKCSNAKVKSLGASRMILSQGIFL